MGMYTGIRVRGRLKPEHVDAVAFVLAYRGDENVWLRAALEFPALAASPGYLEFARKERADCVRWFMGGIGDWERDPEWQNSISGGYLVFQSSIKNYAGEIDAFIEHVVPLLFAEVDHCEKRYEEFDEGELFALESGRMAPKAEPIYDAYEGHWGLCMTPLPEPKRWRSPWQGSTDKRAT